MKGGGAVTVLHSLIKNNLLMTEEKMSLAKNELQPTLWEPCSQDCSSIWVS